MKNFIIAHDLGTTGNTAPLYEREGNLVNNTLYGYGTEYVCTGWAEHNPEDWWRANCTSTQVLLRNTGTRCDDIACVTFGGQMMGRVPVDQQARPLRKAITWADQRSVEQDAGWGSASRHKTCATSPGTA